MRTYKKNYVPCHLLVEIFLAEFGGVACHFTIWLPVLVSTWAFIGIWTIWPAANAVTYHP